MFLDDSGDGGVKFETGSTRFLIMAGVVFHDVKTIEETAKSITELRDDRYRGQIPEFKYSKTKDAVKDNFFDAIHPHRFHVRAIVIDKTKLYSTPLRESPENLKNYAIRQLLTHTFGRVQNAKLIIDGGDKQAFGMPGRDYLMRMVNSECPGTLRDVGFADSRQNVMIQLADMVAGAIHRGVREDHKTDGKHLMKIRPKTYQPHGTLWHFRAKSKFDPSP